MSIKLCMTSFVFGRKYQDYIPLFVYSIKRSYPNYDVFIFLDKHIVNEVKNQLSIINTEGVFIIENYTSNVDFNLSPLHGAAMRWVLWDDRFWNYDYLYTADIDMFYCQEIEGLAEQHIEHMKTINKNFSNVMRPIEKNNRFNFRDFLSGLLSRRFKLSFLNFFCGTGERRQLSGLHFVKVKEYYKKVKPLLDNYKKQLLSFEFKAHHHKGFNDEALLYDIISEANMIKGVPVSTSNKEMLDNPPTMLVFRPHHGVHLGIFREKELPDYQKEILESDSYINYLSTFMKECTTRDFVRLSFYFSDSMINEIENCHSYIGTKFSNEK